MDQARSSQGRYVRSALRKLLLRVSTVQEIILDQRSSVGKVDQRQGTGLRLGDVFPAAAKVAFGLPSVGVNDRRDQSAGLLGDCSG